MCAYDLKSPDNSPPIKKATGLLVSHEDMSSLIRVCPGLEAHPQHQVIAGSLTQGGGNLSTFAGMYMRQFCRAVLDTIPSFNPVAVVEALATFPEEWRPIQDEDVPWAEYWEILPAEASAEAPAEAAAELDRSAILKIDAFIKRLHANLGHPSSRDLLRILKNGGASALATSRAEQFTCDICEARQKPSPPHRSQATRIVEFNDRVGLDVKFLPGWNENQRIRSVNMLYIGSGLRAIVPFFETETAAVIRNIYNTRWRELAGTPLEILVDPAKTNLGEAMLGPAELGGAHVLQTAGEAHWQNGKTETHGIWYERILQRIIDSAQPKDKLEWLECVTQANCAKYALLQVYGMSPAQHVFGRNPRSPGGSRRTQFQRQPHCSMKLQPGARRFVQQPDSQLYEHKMIRHFV
jgi:hypothetical protein